MGMIKSRRNRRPGTIPRDELPRQSGRAERFCTPSDGPVTAEKNTRSRVSVRRRGHGTMACHAIGRAKTRGSISLNKDMAQWRATRRQPRDPDGLYRGDRRDEERYEERV